MIRPLTPSMRLYLLDLVAGANLRRWAAPRWASMRKSLIARGIITRPSNTDGAHRRTELTEFGREIAGKLGPCSRCKGARFIPPTGTIDWPEPCPDCIGEGAAA